MLIQFSPLYYYVASIVRAKLKHTYIDYFLQQLLRNQIAFRNFALSLLDLCLNHAYTFPHLPIGCHQRCPASHRCSSTRVQHDYRRVQRQARQGLRLATR